MFDAGDQEAGSSPAIIVMAKAPRPGQVKTRLIPALGTEEAAQLAACFVRDTVDTAQSIVSHVLVAYTPADGQPELASLLPQQLLWTDQPAGSLTERLQAAAVHAGECGFGPLLLIGTDSPTLPPAYLERAIRALNGDQADVVLGPTEDGGYYLVGFRGPIPRLFEGVAWSTSRVYEQTVRNAHRLGLHVHSLPSWYDVDTPDDLLRLCRDLGHSVEPKSQAPATYRWLLTHHLLPLPSG